MKNKMKTIIQGKYLRNPGIVELIRKLKNLEEQTKRYHEIFFDMNLNVFKKFETERGR